jgi:hypothetical protein
MIGYGVKLGFRKNTHTMHGAFWYTYHFCLGVQFLGDNICPLKCMRLGEHCMTEIHYSFLLLRDETTNEREKHYGKKNYAWKRLLRPLSHYIKALILIYYAFII